MSKTYTGKDTTGRSYAAVIDVKDGDVLIADGGFVSGDGHCIPANAEVTVATDGEGLYVKCSHGKHYLDGQIETAETGVDFYMGFYSKT